MAKKTNQEEENNSNSEVSKNLLNSLLNGYKDDHYNYVITEKRRISSGSLLLDSYIKVMSGSSIRIGGAQAESGKTSQCLLFASNFMKTMPKSKTFMINSEARLSDDMKRRSNLRFTENGSDWNYGDVFVLHSNVMESSCRMIESLLKSMHEQGENLCVIIDSIDMMILNKSRTNEFGDSSKVAGIPFLTKELFRRIGHPINRYNALLLVTTQYQASINLDPYAPKEHKLMPGTNSAAINHMTDYGLFYRSRFNSDYILENPDEKPDPVKNKIIGVYATVEIRKSATDVSGTVLKIPIKKGKVGNQVWTSKEVGDLILAWGLANKKGAWIKFTDDIITQAKNQSVNLEQNINGLNALYEYLDNNQIICDWFYEKFKTLTEI
jgi:hypothetical protein